MDELKPCPFCGGEAEKRIFSKVKIYICIRCYDCGAKTEEIQENVHYSAEEVAIAK